MWAKPKDGHAQQDTTRQKVPDRRIGQIIKLKPEFRAKYKEVHAHVWPEVLKQIRHSNIRDCTSPSFFFFPNNAGC
jgi:hypothetical protein